jgi:hypothetical protein
MMVNPLLVKTFKSFIVLMFWMSSVSIQNIRTINDLNVITSKGITIIRYARHPKHIMFWMSSVPDDGYSFARKDV